MTRPSGWLLLAAAGTLFLPVCGWTEVLATATSVNGGSIHGTSHRVRPSLGYDIGNYAIQRVLFDDVWVDSTSVGTVLVASAASDTEFSAFSARLTDGVADFLCLGTCEEISCAEICAPESLFFRIGAPDLGPAVIDSVSLRIESLSFGRDSRGGQIVQYGFTVTVEGTRGSLPARSVSWGALKARYR